MLYPWEQSFVSIPPIFQKGEFPQVGLNDLVAERSLVDCSEATALKNAGPLTKSALEQINKLYEKQIALAKNKGLSAVIDVHVHRLMPLQYPDLPGWHCVGVPRRSYNGEPDFNLITPEQFSVSLTLSSEPRGICPSEFVKTILKPKLWSKEKVYDDLMTQVDKHNPDLVLSHDGEFVWHCPRSIVRTTVCQRRGVRLSVKLTMFPRPPLFNAVGVPEQVFIR